MFALLPFPHNAFYLFNDGSFYVVCFIVYISALRSKNSLSGKEFVGIEHFFFSSQCPQCFHPFQKQIVIFVELSVMKT